MMEPAISSFISNILPIFSNIVISAFTCLLVAWAKMAKYQVKVDDLKDEKDKILSKIEALRTDVDTLKEFKVYATKFIDKNLYQSNSPLSLTVFGKTLIQESGFEEIFVHEKDNLAALLKEKRPRTKYDAQEMARELMDGLTEYAAFLPLKAYAYSSGKDLGQILRSGAILLRDYYLSTHPEIKD